MLPRATAKGMLRIASLVGMAAAAALTVEYRSLEASFCGPDSGCALLRRTDLAHLWGAGITLPELGLIGFAALFALSLTRHVLWAARLALVVGVAGLGLLVAQLAWGTFCWLCVVSDASAIAAGVAAVFLLRSAADDRADRLSPLRWAALGSLAVAGPALWPSVKPTPPVPAAVRAYYAPGKINVVEFADYECPFCRRLHQPLKALLVPHGDRVHNVRLNVPLDSHPFARDAARAAICVEPSGRGEVYADFLFETEDLSRERLRAEAVRLGVDGAAFDRCLSSPETDRRIERETAVLREAGMEGLPTTYIGGRRFVGVPSEDVLVDALERAARGDSDRGIPAWVYLILLGAVAAAIVVPGASSARDKPRAAPEK